LKAENFDPYHTAWNGVDVTLNLKSEDGDGSEDVGADFMASNSTRNLSLSIPIISSFSTGYTGWTGYGVKCCGENSYKRCSLVMVFIF